MDSAFMTCEGNMDVKLGSGVAATRTRRNISTVSPLGNWGAVGGVIDSITTWELGCGGVGDRQYHHLGTGVVWWVGGTEILKFTLVCQQSHQPTKCDDNFSEACTTMLE